MSASRNEKQTVLEMLINPRAAEQIERRQKQKELLDLLTNKNYEIDVLHQVNTRLGAELALLQKKLGIDHNVILHELESLNQISVAFHYQIEQLEYLDHLFNAYDDASLKQKKMIAMLFAELEDAERKTENLVRDNQYLMLENQNKCKKILEIYHKGNPEDALVPSYNKLQRQMEVDRMETLREENQYLLRHCKELESRCQKIQVDFEESKDQVDKYFGGYKSQAQELKDALIKVDDLLKIKQVLEKKFDEIGEENIELETLRNQLEDKVGKLQLEYKNLKAQFFAVKKSSRQEVDRLSLETESLRLQFESSSKREKQSFNKQMLMEKEIDHLRDSNRALKRQLEKIKGDFQQTLKMMEAYESKVEGYRRKQENVASILQDNKERLDSALLEKDKALMKCQQLEKLIQNLGSRHRDEMSTLKSTFEKIINSQNQKLRILQEERQDHVGSATQAETTLRNQLEKLRRENSLLRQQHSKFINNIKTSSGSEIINKLKEMEERNDGLARVMTQKERAWAEEKEHKEEIIHNLENQVRDINRQLEKERASSSAAIKEGTVLKSKLSILSNDKECLESELTRLKRSLESKSANQTQENAWRIRELQQKLHQAIQKQKSTRTKAIQMLEKYDQAEQKLKGQYQSRILELQGQNERLRRKGKA